MEDPLTKLEVQRSKKTFHSLIMEVHSKEDLAKSNLNPRIFSCINLKIISTNLKMIIWRAKLAQHSILKMHHLWIGVYLGGLPNFVVEYLINPIFFFF